MYNSDTQVIGIPFAGGNAQSFRILEEKLPQNFSWTTLELKGRGGRIREKPLEDIDSMVHDLFYQIKPLIIKQQPYILYGHSLGSLLSYELVKKIMLFQLPLPLSLVVTGRGAPSMVYKAKKSELPYDEFWEAIYDIGGLPKEILAHKELLQLYYPILKADFKAIENYKYQSSMKFNIPITVAVGEDEISKSGHEGPSLNDIQKWQDETIKDCKINLLPGGHFFIFQHPQQTIEIILNSGMKKKEVHV